MNYKMMGKILSQILMVEGVFMIPALFISLHDMDFPAIYGFLATMFFIALVSVILYFFCRKAERKFYAREGLVAVGSSWMVMSLFGCLPFFISGEIPGFVDALFEMVSGFTTTGASILTDVESMSRSMLYWRSFSHWLGGMGVLVFLLAVAPADGQSNGFTIHLLRAESPGPNVGKLVPRMRTTARILYVLYILLTIINFIFLMVGDMPLFDAVCTALGTAGTGGFGIKNDSMASYSPYIQNVCTVFMLLFGVNFSCYYLLVMKQFKEVFRDEELRMYLSVVGASIVLIAFNIRSMYGSLRETIRYAAFQVSSIITSTGYATADFDKWPTFSKAIIVMLMLIGACAGSTGGGLKCGRALLMLKNLRRNTRRAVNPQKVEVVRNNGQMVSEKVLDNTNTYLAAYVMIILISFLLVSVDGHSLTTNVTAVISCFNNIGPGLDAVGPACNYSIYSDFSKLILLFDMLAGRLEIFPILILLSRSTWRRR